MISLIHPSRGRPQKAFKTYTEWIELAGVDVEYILSLDNSDDWKQYAEVFMEIDLPNKKILNDNTSVVEAANEAAKVSTGDIIIYLSDDFKCPEGWGNLVIKEFSDYTTPQLLKVDDCLQPFHVPVLTIPIMNRALYEKLGYFWHPGYKSMHVDVDLFYTVSKLGALKKAPHLKFPHEHVSIGKAEDDETYRRSSANWNQGLEIFNKRKKLGFPV